MRDEIIGALEELIDVNENMTLDTDARTRDLLERYRREPVYVQTDDGSAWCARHWSLMIHDEDGRCIAVVDEETEDPGPCIPIPLYVEAPDP